MATLEYLRYAFRHFAGFCREACPLYVELSEKVAADDAILELATVATDRQPPVNLLFGAVHDLLLAGREHELAAYYRSVGGDRPPDDAYPVFVDFCRAHEREIVAIVSTRRVQTNEVGRCGVLLPGVLFAWERSARRPLHLVDVGASAGFHLMMDRYRYEYPGAAAFGDADAAVIRTETRGPFPVPARVPEVASRVGVDVSPVDLSDPGAARWLQALVWPDQTERLEQLRRAVEAVRRERPRLIRGDVMERLPEVVRDAPAETLPCIYHSHAIYQMSKEGRAEFHALVERLAEERPLIHVALEWLGDDPGPRLHVTLGDPGQRRRLLLADAHHHGAWIRWTERAEGEPVELLAPVG